MFCAYGIDKYIPVASRAGITDDNSTLLGDMCTSWDLSWFDMPEAMSRLACHKVGLGAIGCVNELTIHVSSASSIN